MFGLHSVRIVFSSSAVKLVRCQFGVRHLANAHGQLEATSIVGHTPVSSYREKIDTDDLKYDEHQEIVVKALQHLYDQVQDYKPAPKAQSGGFLKWFSGNSKEVPAVLNKGVYIHGSVGGGKTTLMDLFFECCDQVDRKKRVHFNAFMTNVHAKIHEVKERDSVKRVAGDTKPRPFDPTAPVADDIIKDAWLICFDEFQVDR